MTIENQIRQAAIDGGLPPVIGDLLVSQAKHETGNFKSAVFLANNNAFGYKWRGQSIATQGTKAPASEGDYYAKYATVYDSAKELVLWWKRRKNEGLFKDWADISTPQTYAAYLKRANYYGDSVITYTNALQRYFKEISNNGGLAALVVLLILYIII